MSFIMHRSECYNMIKCWCAKKVVDIFGSLLKKSIKLKRQKSETY